MEQITDPQKQLVYDEIRRDIEVGSQSQQFLNNNFKTKFTSAVDSSLRLLVIT